MIIREQIKNILQKEYQTYQKSEDFPSKEVLVEKIQYFKERFGYNGLRIDGKELLLKIHGPHREDEEQSLTYWLEQKADEEFPKYFGTSRVGHSGHYRVYFSPQDDCWKDKYLKKLSEGEAIIIAEENRDFLLKASKKCEDLLKDLNMQKYREFDKFLHEKFPELHGKQWVHKYLFLMNSELLSSIHSNRYLLHMLLRLGIIPDNPKGYYELDYYFRKIAQELNIPLIHLVYILFSLYGKTHRYWKIDVKKIKQIIGEKKWNSHSSEKKGNICSSMISTKNCGKR